MSDKCSHCKKAIEDTKNRLQCVGPCDSFYHAECAGLKTDSAIKTAVRSGFKCQNCKISLRSGSTSGGVSEDTMSKMLQELKKEIFARFDTDFKEFAKSLTFFSEKIDEFTKVLQEEQNKQQEMKKEIVILKENNDSLIKEVNWLRAEVCELQQYTRSSNLEISGVIETPNENVHKLVGDIAQCIGVEVQPGDVLVAHRVPTKNTKRPKPIIVQLRSKTEKFNWIKAYRSKRKMTCQNINANLPADKFYVNEHLTAYNKNLLYEAKNFAREYNYVYTWVSNGKIFIRKEDRASAIKISSLTDIEALKCQLVKRNVN